MGSSPVLRVRDSRNKEIRVQQTRGNSRRSRSTVPFDLGKYRTIKWRGVWSALVTKRNVLFLKSVGPSDTRPFGSPKAAHQSTISWAEFPAALDIEGKIHW